MTQGNGTSVGIELSVHINTQILAHCNRLCRKSLIGLNDVEVLNLHACLGQNLLRGCHRADSHHFRTDTCQRTGHKSSHRLHAQLLCLLFAHDNDSSSAVIDTGSISCSHESIGIDRTQLGQTLYGRTCTGTLVHLELDHLFLFLYHHRHDLCVKSTCLLGFLCLLLALQGELIQFFPGKSPFPADIVSRCNHMVIIESIPQGILDHGIHQGAIVHPVAVTGLGNRIRCHGHILHTACHHNVGIPCHNHLCCLVHAV